MTTGFINVVRRVLVWSIFVTILCRLWFGWFFWLFEGVWLKIYACQVSFFDRLLCSFDTEYVGLNRLTHLLGTTDVVWLLLAAMTAGFLLIRR